MARKRLRRKLNAGVSDLPRPEARPIEPLPGMMFVGSFSDSRVVAYNIIAVTENKSPWTNGEPCCFALVTEYVEGETRTSEFIWIYPIFEDDTWEVFS